MSNNMKLIDAIMNGDAASAREEFTAAINDKVNTVLDIRRVTMASDVFNQVQEGIEINEFQDTASKRKPLSPRQKIKEIEAEIKHHEETIKRRTADHKNVNHLQWRKDEVETLKKQLEKLKKNETLNPNVVKDLPEDLHADDMMYNDCEEDDLDEAVKLRTKVIITKGPKDVQGKTGFVGEINKGLHKGDESYVIDVQGGGHITLRRGAFKLAAKDKVTEDLVKQP